MPEARKKGVALGILATISFCLTFVCGVFVLSPPTRPVQTWYLVGKVSDLPIDGQPEKLPVYGRSYDAWTRLPDERICEVFARREPDDAKVSVLPAWHSELLIPLRHNPCLNRFESICWNVAFDAQGKDIVASGVGAVGTDLERFPIKIRSNEIWISLEGNSK